MANFRRWIVSLCTRRKAIMKTEEKNLRASRLPVRLKSKMKPLLIK
jgi:hypothetical protein